MEKEENLDNDNSGLNQLFFNDSEVVGKTKMIRIIALIMMILFVIIPFSTIIYSGFIEGPCYCFCGTFYDNFINYIISIKFLFAVLLRNTANSQEIGFNSL